MRQTVAQKRIVVLGATGATGRLVVSTALRRAHHVIALVRRTGSFAPAEGLHEVEWQHLSDVATLTSALTGADAVISTLGGAAQGPTSVCTDAMTVTVPAMQRAGISRLVALSAHGVADSRDRSLFSLAVWAGVGEKMRDKESMEPLVSSSGLDWTIVRPPMLRDTPATGNYRVATDLPVHLWTSVARADVADFLVREVEAPHHLHAYPRITR
ncbi:NAD(P)-binding oxidoreductase [Kineosporia sp. NBRC 101731]|uniref:NAD(P)-dependent oxidoreductase n=1 Tax=Kineosporia sp. NBRC 101731 TaxID=3032199 RepID=UPI0024A27C95|nr:NAD(P)-binding oxidoreductase [Kineosporia sp. NBRC 101731]GLY30770.1 NADH-flavin reductase [Kineosporia sp. NBRC 101731]